MCQERLTQNIIVCNGQGEEYLLEEVVDNAGNKVSVGGRSIFKRCPVLDWLHLSLLHYYSGEDSKKIYKQAPVEVMKRNYMMFHTDGSGSRD